MVSANCVDFEAITPKTRRFVLTSKEGGVVFDEEYQTLSLAIQVANAQLGGVRGLMLNNLEFEPCRMDGVDFSLSNLRDSNLEKLRLNKCDFSVCDLEGAKFPRLSNIIGCDFDGADFGNTTSGGFPFNGIIEKLSLRGGFDVFFNEYQCFITWRMFHYTEFYDIDLTTPEALEKELTIVGDWAKKVISGVVFSHKRGEWWKPDEDED